MNAETSDDPRTFYLARTKAHILRTDPGDHYGRIVRHLTYGGAVSYCGRGVAQWHGPMTFEAVDKTGHPICSICLAAYFNDDEAD